MGSLSLAVVTVGLTSQPSVKTVIAIFALPFGHPFARAAVPFMGRAVDRSEASTAVAIETVGIGIEFSYPVRLS